MGMMMEYSHRCLRPVLTSSDYPQITLPTYCRNDTISGCIERGEKTLILRFYGNIIEEYHYVLSGIFVLSSSSFRHGSRLLLLAKEIASTEIFAKSLLHYTNGRFVTVVANTHHLAWREKNIETVSLGHLTRTQLLFMESKILENDVELG
jgi:hypothetical protein